jgi:hypothetical protein
MGKFRTSVDDLPVLPAQVRLTSGQEKILTLSNRPVPSPQPVNLLVDTGSGRSTLLPSVIAKLNPISRGVTRVATSLAVAEANLFWVRLEFPDTNLEPIGELAVARLSLPASLGSIHGVIGRDLLRRWEYFFYEGRRGQMTIRDRPGFFW